MEYYPNIKNTHPKIHVTWMNLENIMLNEKSITKGNILSDHFYMKCQSRQSHKDRQWISGYPGPNVWVGGEEWARLIIRMGFLLWGEYKFSKLGCGDGYTTLWLCQNHWIVYTLNGSILWYVNCISIKYTHTLNDTSQTRIILTGNIYIRIGIKYNPNQEYKQSRLYNNLNVVISWYNVEFGVILIHLKG